MHSSVLNEKAHALLSPSAAERWLNCPGSLNLSKDFKDERSIYADEGTKAHELCEYLIKNQLAGNLIKLKAESTQEMLEACETYRDYVFSFYEKNEALLVEVKLDFSEALGLQAGEAFGTSDAVLLKKDALHIFDFKFGLGVPVSAERNKQLMLYALGALNAFAFSFDEEPKINLHIIQPRLKNINAFEMTTDDLKKWLEEEAKPGAQRALTDKGTFVCGKWCQFCRARNICRARAEANLALAREDFAPATLTDSEITAILSRIDQIQNWCSDLKEYALKKALEGHKWIGFKLVEGRSVRKYKDEKVVADLVSQAGFDPYEQKLIGITAMQKLLGRSKFEELLNDWLFKAPGKPTLVKEDDKRPEFVPAAVDFKNL